MVKSTGETSPPLAPFLKKCYEMVEDESTDPIISWGSNGDTFVIWDMTQFSVQLLPKYFKHSNFSSFMRQLNIYGFRKVDTDRWEFANEGFIKGQKHLLKNIYRRKNLLAATDQNKSSPSPDIAIKQVDKTKNDAALLKEVENLKNDKNALMQEFIKLRQLQESSENNLVMLRERLQGMEKNQQQMLSFLVMAMQNPGVLFQLLQVKESTWRMAERENILEGEEDCEEEEEEAIISEGTIVRYQPNTPVEPEIQISSASGLDKTRQSDNQQHVDGGKDAFLSIDFLKRLMDEEFSLDSHGPVILPDLPDDGTWKDLLLAYPFVEKTTPQEEKQDYLPSTESFDMLMKQMENTEDDENEGEFDSDNNGDTAQMQLWSSGTNPPAH